ncbi:hypothetical protein GCM10028796_13660 [Ramlibacter monticola]|uniref:Uncharacterized protein n=1 Tax=Ramlibacter monticola TaxID=1926872 RepID=A0A936YYF3_9BURK|nr:hypothetical protein [Ramlibacter monticola]MBL0390202.1 hypothetical protein [Ramlibacter monticola]
MASIQPSTTGTAETQAEAEARLGEAQARMKAASERHAAIVAATSRLGVTPGERRLAQSESKKVDHEMRAARRLLAQAQAAADATKVSSTR